MKPYNSNLLEQKKVCQILQNIAQDIFPFLQITIREPLYAEMLGLEILLISLENSWLDYEEFKEEIFLLAWNRVKKDFIKGLNVENAPFLESKMVFYNLPLESRAAVYLRTKLKFSYEAIQGVLGLVSTNEAKELVREAREKILGKKIIFNTEFLNS